MRPPFLVLLCAAACTRAATLPAHATGSAGRQSEAAEAAEAASLRPGLKAMPVAPDTWVVTQEEAHDSNVLVVRLPDETVLLVSSPFDSDATRALLNWVRAALSPARLVAINTHWHLDGTGGNAAYHEAGVVTYASTQTQTLALERGAQHRRDAAEGLSPAVAEHVRETPIVAARHTFDPAAGLTLTFGEETVHVTYPGPAHSQDNLVVYLPARRILFGGCMLKVGDSLGYLGDASVDVWEAALARVRPLGATVVVPGHGSPGGPEIVDNTLRLVRAAQARP